MSLFGCPSAEALVGSASWVHRIERSRVPCERRLRQLAGSAPASRNTRRLHAVRGKWDANDRCDPRTCSACMPCSPYRRALSSPDELMAFLVCAKVQPWEIESTGFPPSPPHRKRTCSQRYRMLLQIRAWKCFLKTWKAGLSGWWRRQLRSRPAPGPAWEPNVGSQRVASRRLFLSVLFRQPSTETLRKWNAVKHKQGVTSCKVKNCCVDK